MKKLSLLVLVLTLCTSMGTCCFEPDSVMQRIENLKERAEAYNERAKHEILFAAYRYKSKLEWPALTDYYRKCNVQKGLLILVESCLAVSGSFSMQNRYDDALFLCKEAKFYYQEADKLSEEPGGEFGGRIGSVDKGIEALQDRKRKAGSSL